MGEYCLEIHVDGKGIVAWTFSKPGFHSGRVQLTMDPYEKTT